MKALLFGAWAIFRKDIQSELRTRYALNALLLFAACTAVAVSLGVGFLGLRRDPQSLVIQSSLLWIALLFAALNGLSRSFVQEEERRTALALRLAARPTAVFLGKFCFNLVLLLVLDVVTTVLFVIFLRVEIANLSLFVAMLAMGSLSLTTATTRGGGDHCASQFQERLICGAGVPLDCAAARDCDPRHNPRTRWRGVESRLAPAPNPQLLCRSDAGCLADAVPVCVGGVKTLAAPPASAQSPTVFPIFILLSVLYQLYQIVWYNPRVMHQSPTYRRSGSRCPTSLCQTRRPSMNQVRSFYQMFIAVVVFGGLLLTPLAAPAAAQTAPNAQLDGAATAAGTQQHRDGQITLAATSFSIRAPVQAGFARFGSWISRATQLPPRYALHTGSVAGAGSHRNPTRRRPAGQRGWGAVVGMAHRSRQWHGGCAWATRAVCPISPALVGQCHC